MSTKYLVLFFCLHQSHACLSRDWPTWTPKKIGDSRKPFVVFIGDSITQWFLRDGRQVWKRHYEPIGVANVGVAGDGTQDTLDRLESGVLDKFNTRLVILQIGTNDLARGHSENYVNDQIGKVINYLKNKIPQLQIILLAILPRGGARIQERVGNTNLLIQNYHDGQTIHFLNMEQTFLTPLGHVKSNLYWPDQLHLSTQGYQAWAETMAPLFYKILDFEREIDII